MKPNTPTRPKGVLPARAPDPRLLPNAATLQSTLTPTGPKALNPVRLALPSAALEHTTLHPRC